LGIEIPVVAAAMGAAVIEKHFTLDRTLPGPDHAASLEPNELKAMVSAIRDIEKALGDGVKKPTSQEIEISKVARKSLVYGNNLIDGSIIKKDDLQVKRPGTGISPFLYDEMIGRRLTKNVRADQLVNMDDFE
jgi:sialic acid synthase SpsE